MGGEDIVSDSNLVVDGDISARKLITLIHLKREENALDYKAEYNLSETRCKVEMACDTVAMANTEGGYIVIGIAEDEEQGGKYTPVGLDEKQLTSLDITTLQSQVESFLGTSLEIQLQVHKLQEFDNKSFALIYVPQSKELPIVFEKMGNYHDKDGKQGNKFREGDIFVRRGAASVKANQSDMRRIVSHIRRREKEVWTEDILGMKDLADRMNAVLELVMEGKSPNSQKLQGESYDETMYYVDGKTFEAHILELLERDKSLSVKRYLREGNAKFFSHISELRGAEDDAIQRIQDNNRSYAVEKGKLKSVA